MFYLICCCFDAFALWFEDWLLLMSKLFISIAIVYALFQTKFANIWRLYMYSFIQIVCMCWWDMDPVHITKLMLYWPNSYTTILNISYSCRHNRCTQATQTNKLDQGARYAQHNAQHNAHACSPIGWSPKGVYE